MYFGKFILLPFFLALFFYLVIKSITNKFLILINQRLGLRINEITAMSLMFSTVFLFLYFIWIILKFNLISVMQKSENYQENFDQVTTILSNLLSNGFFQSDEILKSIDLILIFSNVLNNLTAFAGNFSFIIIFLIFFIVEEKYFIKKIKIISKSKNIKILNKINSDIYSYFQLKTLTSCLTGILTFLILFLMKSDLAPAFGILSFFLNFIPFIGSLLSIALPFLFTLIQFLSYYEPLFTLLLLLIVQIYVGNILEPKLMGKTLNISPLVMIIFLTVMGKLWGITGMFLSVPILVVFLIILSNFNSTKRIAILVSEKGDL